MVKGHIVENNKKVNKKDTTHIENKQNGSQNGYKKEFPILQKNVPYCGP